MSGGEHYNSLLRPAQIIPSTSARVRHGQGGGGEGAERGRREVQERGGGARARTKGEEVVVRLGVDGDIIILASSVMILCLLVFAF